MRFAFTDDQLLFRDAVRELLVKEYPPVAIRTRWESAEKPELVVWRALADMGVIGLMIGEDHGGLGLLDIDLVLIMEELGRAAVAEPVLETTAVAAPLLAESNEKRVANWLGRVASGDAVLSVRTDDGMVADADRADAVVVWDAAHVALVPGEALESTHQPSVDAARRLFVVEWSSNDEVVIAEGPAAAQLAERAQDRGALAAAAMLVGLSAHLLDVTVEYVKQRNQFGVPIGSFQAVKHHLANGLLALEFAKPAVYRAAYSLSHDPEHASRDVSMAKCVASDAAREVAKIALQGHGAIAYTVEYDLHLWLKRVWALAGAWGDATWHRRRVAERVLGSSAAH